VNAKTLNNSTPLHFAMACSNPLIVQLLLKKGANPNKFNYGFVYVTRVFIILNLQKESIDGGGTCFLGT
jgi:ankyrin repeat protein